MRRLFFSLLCLLCCTGNYAQEQLSKQAVIGDIDSFIAILEEVHFNPYLFIAEDRFDRQVAEIKTALPDSLSIEQFIVHLYRLTALLDDAHTSPFLIQPQLLPALHQEQLLGLSLTVSGNRLFVYKMADEGISIPGGAEICAINGISSATLFQEFRSYFGGDKAYRQEMALRFFSYLLFLKGIKPPFTIQYKTEGSDSANLLLNKGKTFRDILVTTLPHLKKEYDFRLVDNKSGYLDFRSMDGSLDRWGAFLDSVFLVLRSEHIHTLAIDIRNNSGGNSLFANYLLAYITRKPFLLAGGKCWKVSRQMKKYQQENGGAYEMYTSKADNTLWCVEDCVARKNPVVADTVYNGKVYFLTGPFTFSSANMLADAVKTYKLAEIIGQPTGEYTNDFGETMQLTLPNSKVVMQLTTSFEYNAGCEKGHRVTVVPDHVLVPSPEDLIKGKDIALDYVLKQSGPEIEPDTFTLFDKERKRQVPVAIYSSPVAKHKNASVVIFNHGYGQNKGGDYLHYSYLTNALAAQGYFVISIQHELPGDELMNTSGIPKIVRRPFWERGADNIRFVIEEMKKSHPELDFEHISLIGHSNGGDIAALFPQKYPGYVGKIITLDNRRMDLPRKAGLQVYSLRSADQLADEGVLPTAKEKQKYGIIIVHLQDIKHNDMNNDANEQQRAEINSYLLQFLNRE